ncbi:hypothetical protein [Aquimarina brevivitae]|uniref:Uncharacterized protein n=1 Tax=Aquimarina brevivitae TaxID=323412 RepID=A0A4Q7NYV5_9FLAO|nr:hypothetical protein [Aquimarina brevivitae]RZS92168.1 hypothetical protein EV197_2803 [Aquimarina brevivitae]
MYSISDITSILTAQEKQQFIRYLKKKNKKHSIKNITFFELLNQGKKEKEIETLLYKKSEKAAYHALRKRLKDALLDFIAITNFESETSEEFDILKLLLCSRIFFEQRNYSLAFNLLKKAELKAMELDQYGLLNEIYYTKIQHINYDARLNLQEVLLQYKSNKSKLTQEENLNIFRATLEYQLNHYVDDLRATVDQAMVQSEIYINEKLTIRSSYKLLELLNTIGHHQRNYHHLLPLFEEIYQQIIFKKELQNKNQFYHIQIFYLLANANFRTRNFIKASEFLEAMYSTIESKNSKYAQRFFPQYTLLKALVLNYTGNAIAAIKLLSDFPYHKHKNQQSYILDLKLSLVVFYVQQQELQKAMKLIQTFNRSDNWYQEKAGITWVLKKNITTMLIYLDKENIDLFESTYKSFTKKYINYLKQNKEVRTLEFLKLISAYYKDPLTINSQDFKTRVNNTLTTKNKNIEDVFEMSIYAWLKAKINRTDLYSTTLELVAHKKR